MKLYVNILIFSIFLSVNNIFSAEKIRYDSEPLKTRSLPQYPSQIYTDRDFQYNETPQEPNIFERIGAWIWQKIADFLNRIFDWDLKADTVTGRKILWITVSVLLAVLLAIGIYFAVKKFGKSLGRGDKMLISVDEVERNLAEIDINRLIETAVKQGNYRLAVRFCYLKTLKMLSEKQTIEYQYQKTNREYIYELKDEALKAKFSEISAIFDYCWYGGYEVGEADFLEMKQKIEKISNFAEKF
ncbi:MAG: DUF4129 domain-containing protein [Prevotellaceae bacterium]|jgi:hypothetical protein|nr:DUF4129 domain-containing protein [Prevotellaceae bacterium]